MPHHCAHADAGRCVARRGRCNGPAAREYPCRHDQGRRRLRAAPDQRLRGRGRDDLDADRLADPARLVSRGRCEKRLLSSGRPARDPRRHRRQRQAHRVDAAPRERQQVLPAAEYARREPVAGRAVSGRFPAAHRRELPARVLPQRDRLAARLVARAGPHGECLCHTRATVAPPSTRAGWRDC